MGLQLRPGLALLSPQPLALLGRSLALQQMLQSSYIRYKAWSFNLESVGSFLFAIDCIQWKDLRKTHTFSLFFLLLNLWYIIYCTGIEYTLIILLVHQFNSDILYPDNLQTCRIICGVDLVIADKPIKGVTNPWGNSPIIISQTIQIYCSSRNVWQEAQPKGYVLAG